MLHRYSTWNHKRNNFSHLIISITVQLWDIQWMDKIMETVLKDTNFCINTELGSFTCNTACILLGKVSCKFSIISSGILYHSSRKISSSCLREDGGGNLILTLLCKTGHSGLMIFKSGNCAGQRRCWSASSFSSKQDWTLVAVCMSELSSWKIVSLLENKIWFIGCTWLPTVSTESLAVMWPFSVIIGPAKYQGIAAWVTTDLPPCFTVETRHQDYRLPWMLFKPKPSLMLGTTWRTACLIILRITSQTSRFYDYHTVFFTFWCCFQ